MLFRLSDRMQSGLKERSADVGCSVLRLTHGWPRVADARWSVRVVTRHIHHAALLLVVGQVVGGVTSPDAWGDTDHSHGAAFLDDATHAQGVVGCVMTGPFKVSTPAADTLKCCHAKRRHVAM